MRKRLLLGRCTWLCYESGEDSSGDMPTELVRKNVLKMMLFTIILRYFLCSITAGSALVCLFGYVLKIQAWVCLWRLTLSVYMVQIRAFGLCVRESFADAGVHNSFEIVELSRKPGEKRKYCKMSQKELEARRWESVCFPLG